MAISTVCRKGKLVALGVLMACGLLGGTAFAADTTSSGYELAYFHAYKATKTYAIRFKNGVRASFDFEHDTAILYDQTGNPMTFTLEQVLLQANDGNVQAATEMYNQMYNDITATHADAIMALATLGSAGTYRFPGEWIGIGDVGTPLWSTPTGGDCWPIPNFCHQWPGGLTRWGNYYDWWGGAFGDPAPTPQPPDPDGCAPNDTGCIVHETKRQIACDNLTFDNAAAYSLTAVAGATCGAVGNSGAAGRLACIGTGLPAALAVHKLNKDTKTCRSP